MRAFVSAQLYFLADNRSFYTTLADDTALQTLFGRLTGAAGALTLQLMAGAVSDRTFAAIVERSLNPKWVAARGIVGDYTNVLAAPTTGGWAIAYKQNVFYLREPIALEASLPEWGITITDGAHLPFDIATAFGELYERLIVGGRAPSSDAERAFVTEYRRNVVRVM